MDINIGINKKGNEDILLLELREHMVFGFEHIATILCIRTQEDSCNDTCRWGAFIIQACQVILNITLLRSRWLVLVVWWASRWVFWLLEMNVLMAWQCICNCYIIFLSAFPLWCCRLMETCSSPQNLWMHWKFLILPLLLEAARALWISQPLCLTGM